MFYAILARILRKHVLFHLIIPLAVGVLVELVYIVREHGQPRELLSANHIALYAGVFVAYFVVTGLLIRSETDIGIRRIELNDLAGKLRGAKSLFTVAPTPLEEWFDPAAQGYFATLYGERLASDKPFRYERVLIFPARNTRKLLNADYLDGYYAKCLIGIHKRLSIDLYFLEWRDIRAILEQLTPAEKIDIGYYPSYAASLPPLLLNLRMLPVRRKRVRRIASGVIETSSGARRAFDFKKHDNVVDVEVLEKQPQRANAYIHLVDLIKQTLYDEHGVVQPIYDFTAYYKD